MMKKYGSKLPVLTLICLVFLTGCVSQSDYDALLAERDALVVERDELAGEVEKLNGDIAELQAYSKELLEVPRHYYREVPS